MVTTENTTALDNTKFYKIIVRFVLSKLIKKYRKCNTKRLKYFNKEK